MRQAEEVVGLNEPSGTTITVEGEVNGQPCKRDLNYLDVQNLPTFANETTSLVAINYNQGNLSFAIPFANGTVHIYKMIFLNSTSDNSQVQLPFVNISFSIRPSTSAPTNSPVDSNPEGIYDFIPKFSAPVWYAIFAVGGLIVILCIVALCRCCFKRNQRKLKSLENPRCLDDTANEPFQMF